MLKTKRTWTLTEVQSSLPLVRIILSSLREHALSFHSLRRDLVLMDKRKLNKKEMIEQNKMRILLDEETENLRDCLDELSDLSVLCAESIGSVVIFPFTFNNDSQLGWFVYYYFGNELYWRVDGEPLATKRSILQLPRQ